LDLNPILINSIKNIAREISTLDFDVLGVNSINVDFSDVTNQVYFQSLFVQNFLSEEGWSKLKIKSGTLANSNPVIDKSDYLSLLPTHEFI
jgi:NTE family protein